MTDAEEQPAAEQAEAMDEAAPEEEQPATAEQVQAMEEAAPAEEQPATLGVAAALEEVGVATPALTRREFLYYLWASSMVVFLGGATGVTLWFAFPRFREGEFGGIFPLPIEDIPAPDAPPKSFSEGRFWLVNLGEAAVDDPRQPDDYEFDLGVRVLYQVCVHLGCLYKWVPTNDRFECPCHGSKYLKSNARIGGPANRNLDQFFMEVIDASGNVLAQTEPTWPGDREGTALAIPSGAVALRIDTGRRMDGAPNTRPGGGT